MLIRPDYITARDILLEALEPLGVETAELDGCTGRVLAKDVVAEEDIPAFDRSAYDGFALRSADTSAASPDAPAVLRILEEIPAGAVPHYEVCCGTAAKILTGAPIPRGADTVVMYEKTVFDEKTVSVSARLKSGDNIIRAGEDARRGSVILRKGTVIDACGAGLLASLGVVRPELYRVPRVAVISTGSELAEAAESPGPGKIRNSNRYMISAALKELGCLPVYMGSERDDASAISKLISKCAEEFDAVISTGGVSAGDYDLTPAAMEICGAKMLFQGTAMKPGMACAYAVKDSKPICALSGSPAAAITNFHAVAAPALRKMSGRYPLPVETSLILLDGFGKKSPMTRLLRGRLELIDGRAGMRASPAQGNSVLSSGVGCDIMAVIPAGSGPIAPGTVLKGFFI